MMELTESKIQEGLSVFESADKGKLLTHINSCVHCGLCAESCIYYNVDPDEHFVPAKKVELVSSVYRRYQTFSGKMFPWLTKARKIDGDTVNEMVDLLYGACTMCGRCVSHCSIGVDISYLVRTGRSMLSKMDCVPETLQATVNTALESGNNMGITTQELTDTLEWLEDDLKYEVDDDNATIPVNQKDVDILYTLNPREPKFFPLSISAMAKIFHAAGESWTLSTGMYDVTNYAYFSGNESEAETIARRLVDEMGVTKAMRCVLAECGHGDRAFMWEGPNWLKQQYEFNVLTSVELLAEYIREGRIKVDPGKIEGKVTLHDPCNLVRSGGIVEEQRFILRNVVSDFVEMNPHGIDNLCCGGGGGQLAMSEYNERRMKITGMKADQIRKTGAIIVVTPCHNCVDQLTQTNIAYKLNVQIKTLAEIVADAIVLDSKS